MNSLPPAVRRSGADTPPGGIYIHIPFCRRKCAYCDFYSTTDLSLMPAFLEALEREIRGVPPGALSCDSIHFGGGTPSLLAPPETARILCTLAAVVPLRSPVEITLEANPGTLGPAELSAFRAAGVNRLTIGVQSFQDPHLKLLGRIHTAAEARRVIEQARAAGFGNLGIDLIYGLPGQSRDSWRQDLEEAAGRGLEHIACYMLTLEPGTPLSERHRLGGFDPAPEKEVAELFLATEEFLTRSGYTHYEVSNFARCDPAAEGGAWVSRHNCKYWSYAPYLGFGPAAHSFLPPRRFWNHRSLTRYLSDLASGRAPREAAEELSGAQQMTEIVMLGLRTKWGVDLADFRQRFGEEPAAALTAAAEGSIARGLLKVNGSRLAPTLRGLLYLDRVTGDLLQTL
jgi:oxygen-independent coproporphyrinogen III oxidase